jgi:hypothetical protein
MLKRLAILALLCVPFVSAKSYVISLPNKTQVGTAVLKPGDYSLSVNGSEAVLTDDNGHRTKVTAKVEAADAVFPYTSAVCTPVNGVDQLEYVAIKGTKDKILLNR